MDHAASREVNCCIARYSVANNAYNNNMPSLDYIMRRFRPIAPKPTTSAGSNSIVAGASATTTDIGTTGSIKYNIIRPRRGKRKATASRCSRGKKVTTTTSTTKTIPLLPLLPERRTEDDDSPSSGSSCNSSSDLTIRWNFEGDDDHFKAAQAQAAQVQVMMSPPVRVAGSIVTVECVMETWEGGDDATVLLYGLGCTDEEKMMRLQMDACPGFISDGGDRVVWTNGAYKDMVGIHAEDEMRVLLAMKGGIIGYGRAAFSCRVRMMYARGKDKCSLTLPCDVWRMEFGGYAWRLDINAALSLGR